MDAGGLREPAGFVAAGIILKAHGLRGEVKVRPFTQAPENLTRYRDLYLGDQTAEALTPLRCAQARVSGGAVILKLAGCPDRNAAERLVGQQVWLAIADLPPAGEGEYYLHTLTGKRVETEDGQDLGQVSAIIAAGSQDLLVIRKGEDEVLVPAVREFLRQVDRERVVVDLPPGLLDLDR